MRPVWAEVDLNAIRANVRTIKARTQAQYLAVVKANAYGHGDVPVAKAALDAGATWLGVILVAEGRRLREAGIDAPILTLHEPDPSDAAEAVALGLVPSVFTETGIGALDEAAERARTTVPVHLKVDTGLNRLGMPVGRIDESIAALAKASNLEVQGVFSHFAFADQPDHAFIDTQISRFNDVLDVLRGNGIDPPIKHLANSAATLTRPETHFDLVRVGIATYGLAPGPALADSMSYAPAMALKARVAMVKRIGAGEGVSYGLRFVTPKDTTIASIPLGYADGWTRHAGGTATVLIGGQRHSAVGTVCMDSFMVDVGDAEVEVGDEVVLFGRQGDQTLGAEEIADAMGTINYEVVTQISARVPRVHVGG